MDHSHAKNLASAATSKELSRQLSLKYVSLLSLKLERNEQKEKPSLSNLPYLKNMFLFYFLIMGHMS